MKREVFEGIFRRLYPRLVRYARLRVPPHVADEVAAAALERLWLKDLADPEDMSAMAGLTALTFRIADGVLRNVIRAHARRNAAEFPSDELVTGQLTSALLVEEAENNLASIDWFERLSAGEQAVLILIAQGYSVSETAAALDVTPGAVSARLQRVKKKLRQAARRNVRPAADPRERLKERGSAHARPL